MKTTNREQVIIRTGVLGVLMNLALVGMKATVGLVAGSIAMVLDALNNLTDVMSSVVTIIGAKLARKAPDREHPYGHGRIEYVATLAVGLIIFAAGIMALVEAVPKIFDPELAHYEWWSLVVIVTAMVMKIFYSRHAMRLGREMNANVLVASGRDAQLDALLSLSTLIGAVTSMTLGISMEGMVGVVIAAVIVGASVEILSEAWADLIGRKADDGLMRKIKNTLRTHREVEAVRDLSLHSYGPTQVVGSGHIQVHGEMTAREIHRLTHEMKREIMEKYRVDLTIGILVEGDEE